MKVLLLHGPGEVGSRKKLVSIKESWSGETLTLGSQTTQVEVNDQLSQQNLFANNRLIILENPSEALKLVKNRVEEVTLVIWLDHDIDQRKSLFKSLKEVSAEIINFPEAREVSVFPFLDNLADGKKEAFLELKKLKMGGFDSQYFITMIFYMLRSLVATPKNAPQFVRSKLQRQRTRFSQEELTNLYKDILEIDFKLKSGLLENDQAQFLLVNKFL